MLYCTVTSVGSHTARFCEKDTLCFFPFRQAAHTVPLVHEQICILNLASEFVQYQQTHWRNPSV